MSPTVAELRDEVREELDVSASSSGDAPLRSRTLEKLAHSLGHEETRGGAPRLREQSLREQIRRQLAKRESDEPNDWKVSDSKPLRKDELPDVLDAIEAEQGGESA